MLSSQRSGILVKDRTKIAKFTAWEKWINTWRKHSPYTGWKLHTCSHRDCDTMNNHLTPDLTPAHGVGVSTLPEMLLAICNCWKRETQFSLKVLIMSSE